MLPHLPPSIGLTGGVAHISFIPTNNVAAYPYSLSSSDLLRDNAYLDVNYSISSEDCIPDSKLDRDTKIPPYVDDSMNEVLEPVPGYSATQQDEDAFMGQIFDFNL